MAIPTSIEHEFDLLNRGKKIDFDERRCFEVIIETKDGKPYEGQQDIFPPELAKWYGPAAIKVQRAHVNRWDADREAKIYNSSARRLRWKSRAVVKINPSRLKSENLARRITKLAASIKKKTGFEIAAYGMSYYPYDKPKVSISLRCPPLSLNSADSLKGLVEPIRKLSRDSQNAIRCLVEVSQKINKKASKNKPRLRVVGKAVA